VTAFVLGNFKLVMMSVLMGSIGSVSHLCSIGDTSRRRAMWWAVLQ
jgi:hypothetical protein